MASERAAAVADSRSFSAPQSSAEGSGHLDGTLDFMLARLWPLKADLEESCESGLRPGTSKTSQDGRAKVSPSQQSLFMISYGRLSSPQKAHDESAAPNSVCRCCSALAGRTKVYA